MTSGWPPPLSRRTENLLVAAIVTLALFLRLVAPWYAPRGWRDDELSSALVVTGHVLDGDFRLYYPDASGHEGLYEYFQAASMIIFGPGVWGVRGPSILFGTLAVFLTYLLVRRLFGWPTAAIASMALALSLWSLMYSRTGQRHISVTVTTLLGFYILWRAVQKSEDGTPAYGDFALAGVLMGLGFYTYFASRGVPLILATWGAYLFLWRRDLWRSIWRGLALTLVIAAALGVPLAITLRQQPEAETRVAEVAVPLRDALQGNFSTLGRYALTTLSMFTHEGDEEWLYNIPHRPVFGALGAVLFWSGILLAGGRAFGRERDPHAAFLLLWLAAGLAPGALSVPAASLGHTILAQPATMVFPALAITAAGRWLSAQGMISSAGSSAAPAVLTAALLFLGWEGVRGIHDYWFVWPHDPLNRVLHNTDLHEAARWLNAQPGNRNIAIGSFLVERWDQESLKLDLRGGGWRVRAFDPRTTVLAIPDGGIAIIPEYLHDGWAVGRLGPDVATGVPYLVREIAPPTANEITKEIARFDNGLTLVRAEVMEAEGSLDVIETWRVDRTLDLPPFPLLSKPPAPGQDDTPRLAIFVQLLDAAGQRVTGADGLGVDPYTLYLGDVVTQRFVVPVDGVSDGTYRLVTGLYNPATGERHRDMTSGQDAILLQTWQRP